MVEGASLKGTAVSPALRLGERLGDGRGKNSRATARGGGRWTAKSIFCAWHSCCDRELAEAVTIHTKPAQDWACLRLIRDGRGVLEARPFPEGLSTANG